MGYVAYFCCDRCNDQWKVYYADMASMTLGDACQKCTADHQWGTIEEVLVDTHFFEEVDSA